MKRKSILLGIALMLLAIPLQTTVYATPPTDLNEDGKVDIEDIAIAAKAFGSYNYTESGGPVHPRWDPRCDFDGDHEVTIKDILIIAKDFGKTYP